jgi:hypothetical protein
MKSPFVDHSWTKIVEGKFEPELVKVCVDSKIKQLDEVAEIIRSNNGSDAVENVLEYKFVLRALEQCRDYVTNSSSAVTSEDHYIYYCYATNQLKEAERIIDDELSHLDL